LLISSFWGTFVPDPYRDFVPGPHRGTFEGPLVRYLRPSAPDEPPSQTLYTPLVSIIYLELLRAKREMTHRRTFVDNCARPTLSEHQIKQIVIFALWAKVVGATSSECFPV